MTDSAEQLIGTRLGSGTLERLIGSGGMGVVYLAHQAHLDRDVAIKVLRSGGSVLSKQNEEFLERFRREAHVIAQLDHVHILPIYEYGEQQDLAYLVMPYLTGGSLYERLARQPRPPLADVMLYIDQAASALDYAHKHKIVHRDIKPRNMLFHADGRLVLVDFGIAHILRDDREKSTGHTLTGSGNFIGSVDYMAPEMVRGRHVDLRTDIYELGVVLFQMLAGRLPFKGNTPFVVAAQHLHEPVPALLEFTPSLTPDIDHVVRKAMAKDPDERYNSTLELARELRLALLASGLLPTRGSSNSFSNTETGNNELLSTFVAPPRGEDTQKLYTGEIPTLQQPMAETFTAPSTPRPDAWPQSGGVVETGNFERSLPGSQPGRPGYNTASGQSGQSRDAEQRIAEIVSEPTTALKRERRHVRWSGIGIVALLCLVLLGLGFAFLHIYAGMGTAVVVPTPTAIPVQPTSPLTPTADPGLPPTQQAEQVVQAYYSDINQQHYQDAYNLWGKDYQSQQTSAQFAQGFSTTQHDDIFMKESALLPDGTVKVNVVLYATNGANSGSNISAYQGYYIVGQEGGSWKLLKATLAQVNAPASIPTPTPR